MIFRRLPASSSFVLAAARLRALQLDPGRAARGPGQLRGRIQKNSQPSPAARVVTGPDPYALLTLVALMGAAVRPGARALICRLPAGAPALLSEHCERLWLLPRAEVLAKAGLEVPVLCKLQGGAMLGAGRESSPASWVTVSGEPGPEGPPSGAFGLCEPAKAGLSSSYDFTSRPDGLARVVV